MAHALGSSFATGCPLAARRRRAACAASAPATIECAATRANKAAVLERLQAKLGPETMFIAGVNFKGFTARGAQGRPGRASPRAEQLQGVAGSADAAKT